MVLANNFPKNYLKFVIGIVEFYYCISLKIDYFYEKKADIISLMSVTYIYLNPFVPSVALKQRMTKFLF